MRPVLLLRNTSINRSSSVVHTVGHKKDIPVYAGCVEHKRCQDHGCQLFSFVLMPIEEITFMLSQIARTTHGRSTLDVLMTSMQEKNTLGSEEYEQR